MMNYEYRSIKVIRADSTFLGSMETGVATAPCARGEDGAVLSITASTALDGQALRTKDVGFYDRERKE